MRAMEILPVGSLVIVNTFKYPDAIQIKGYTNIDTEYEVGIENKVYYGQRLWWGYAMHRYNYKFSLKPEEKDSYLYFGHNEILEVITLP